LSNIVLMDPILRLAKTFNAFLIFYVDFEDKLNMIKFFFLKTYFTPVLINIYICKIGF